MPQSSSPGKVLTRNEMLRAWSVFYRTKGKAEAVALATGYIELLTRRLKERLHKTGSSAITVCLGMAIGVHKYALWYVSNRRAV
jgi:hypothetical protein